MVEEITRSLIIEVHDLWFSYNGNVVLKDVNLEIDSGDFVALIGPNGGGKTTLIKLMLGLLEPDRGMIRVLGKQPGEAAPRIGYVPQDISVNRSFPISVQDLVLMGRMLGGGGWRHYSRKDRDLARSALEKAEMWDLRDRRIGELSGGQRQRVFVARALAAEPEILFLDEPTANVDSQGQGEFYELLRELNKAVTVLMVTHDFSVISSFVKSVACVNQQVFFHRSPEITNEMIEMAYCCPVEIIAHGVPHRVLHTHGEE